MKFFHFLLLILVSITFVQCSEGEEEEPIVEAPTMNRGSWSSGYPTLFHDGEPFESDNFIIYTDKSSEQWKITVASLAEQALIDIKAHLNVESQDFDFVPTQLNRKIHILTNFDQWNIAVAYRDGIIIRSKDGPNFFGDHETWQKVFEHEITHVVEFLLIGELSNSYTNMVWLREGFGNYGARNHRIQTLQEVNDWRAKMENVPGEGNPIGIRTWSDFPQSVVDGQTTGEYYGFFELGVRYLIDEENGNGTSIEDFKAYLDDLGSGANQETAFSDHFGMAQADFKEDFWTLMEGYLAQ